MANFLSSLGIWPLQILQRQRDVPVSIHTIFDRTKVDNIKFTRKYITLRYKKDDVDKSRNQLHFHQTLILLRFLWCLGRSQAKVNFIFNIRNISRPNTWIKKCIMSFKLSWVKIFMKQVIWHSNLQELHWSAVCRYTDESRHPHANTEVPVYVRSKSTSGTGKYADSAQ